MFHVVTKTKCTRRIPNSVSLTQTMDSHYLWITPYTDEKEANEAADYLKTVVSRASTVYVEKVDAMDELADQAQELETL